ncbi:MAG: 5-formyltetrahydrofolate cyclo-ligase [Terriglobia bacterium]
MVEQKKRRVRHEILAERDALPESIARAKSQAVIKRLVGLEEFRQAQTTLLYMATGSEVETRSLLPITKEAGKRAAVPFCRNNETRLRVSLVGSENDLEPARFGILEPRKERIREISVADADLIIVPGIVFDLGGHRIGYGQGLYDRLLEGVARTPLVGLAYDLQIVDKLPKLHHDVAVDLIATESRLIEAQDGPPGAAFSSSKVTNS